MRLLFVYYLFASDCIALSRDATSSPRATASVSEHSLHPSTNMGDTSCMLSIPSWTPPVLRVQASHSSRSESQFLQRFRPPLNEANNALDADRIGFFVVSVLISGSIFYCSVEVFRRPFCGSAWSLYKFCPKNHGCRKRLFISLAAEMTRSPKIKYAAKR